MAVEIITRTKCDRCDRVIGDVNTVEEGHIPKPPLVYVEKSGEEVVSLSDLCEKCNGRVEALVKQIRLDGTDKPKKDEQSDDTQGEDSQSEEHSSGETAILSE